MQRIHGLFLILLKFDPKAILLIEKEMQISVMFCACRTDTAHPQFCCGSHALHAEVPRFKPSQEAQIQKAGDGILLQTLKSH